MTTRQLTAILLAGALALTAAGSPVADSQQRNADGAAIVIGTIVGLGVAAAIASGKQHDWENGSAYREPFSPGPNVVCWRSPAAATTTDIFRGAGPTGFSAETQARTIKARRHPMKTAILIGALACAAGIASASLAQDGKPVDPSEVDIVTRMNAAVNTVVVEHLGDLVPPGDMLRLLVVAQQQALAQSCEGFEVDWEKYGEVMHDILADLQALTEEDQNNLPVDRVLSAYSMSVGGQLAVAAYDPDAHCAHGGEIRATLSEDTDGRLMVLAFLD